MVPTRGPSEAPSTSGRTAPLWYSRPGRLVFQSRRHIGRPSPQPPSSLSDEARLSVTSGGALAYNQHSSMAASTEAPFVDAPRSKVTITYVEDSGQEDPASRQPGSSRKLKINVDLLLVGGTGRPRSTWGNGGQGSKHAHDVGARLAVVTWLFPPVPRSGAAGSRVLVPGSRWTRRSEGRC